MSVIVTPSGQRVQVRLTDGRVLAVYRHPVASTPGGGTAVTVAGATVTLVDEDGGAAASWMTDDGREFRGSTVHVTWPTAGAHTVTKTKAGADSKVVTAVTTAAPIDRWPVTEGKLHPGLVPHTGAEVARQVGGYQSDGVTPLTEMLPDPALTAPRGMIPVSYPRNDPQYRFASDYDPTGTMDWPDLIDAMSVGWTAIRKSVVLDLPPNRADGTHVYPHVKAGYRRGRLACLRIGGAGGSIIDEITSEGNAVLAAPETADNSVKFEVWSTNTEVKNQLNSWGLVPDAGGMYWATAKQHGNITAKGGQAECRLIEILKPGVTISNVTLGTPGAKANGDVDVLGSNGIRIDRVNDVILSHVHMKGCSKGWEGYPPGETAQVAVVGVTGRFYRGDCIIDGSRPDGVRVSGSPLSVASCTVPKARMWLDERNTECFNRVSMNTLWNANVYIKRLDMWTQRVAGPHQNEEDFNWLDEANYLLHTIGDRIDVVSRYDGTGTSTVGNVHVTCTSGPRAKASHKSNQFWVDWEIVTPSAFEYFSGITGATGTMSIQSQLSYQGVDSTMGETGPQELWVDGVQPPMGWRAWRHGRWQVIASNKAEKSAGNPTGPLLTPTAPSRSWPSGMGRDLDKKVAIHR